MNLPKNIDILIATESPELRKIDKGELALYLLQKLTPQGSEYYNDPLACYKHVKQRFWDTHLTILKLSKIRKNSEHGTEANNTDTNPF